MFNLCLDECLCLGPLTSLRQGPLSTTWALPKKLKCDFDRDGRKCILRAYYLTGNRQATFGSIFAGSPPNLFSREQENRFRWTAWPRDMAQHKHNCVLGLFHATGFQSGLYCNKPKPLHLLTPKCP